MLTLDYCSTFDVWENSITEGIRFAITPKIEGYSNGQLHAYIKHHALATLHSGPAVAFVEIDWVTNKHDSGLQHSP